MNLREETLKLLERDSRSTTEIAKAAGVNKHWLDKFKSSWYANPGIESVQLLYDHLSTVHKDDEAAA